MAYYDHNSRYNQPRRNDPYFSGSRDAPGYPSNPGLSGYTSSYDRRYAAAPPPPPKRSSAQPSYRPDSRYTTRNRWPPVPSCEEEAASLAREFPTQSTEARVKDAASGEATSPGAVDQYPIIEEIERPKITPETSDDRRFVLVSDPAADDPARQQRRKSFAERGNMHHLKTDVDDEPPLFTKRTSTPYAYTKPQKESVNPSSGEYLLSPEPITPGNTNVPRSVPSRNAWDAPRDQNARPSRDAPTHSRYDSFTQSPRTPKHDVFEDSDVEEDTTRLRTERKPARYSFVKSDLQKEDLRTNLLDSQAKADSRKPDPPRSNYDSSSGSSKNPTPGSQSPRSSTSSVNNGYSREKARPAPLEPASYSKSSSTYSDSRPARPASPLRPSSPSYRDAPSSPPRSPKLPPRRRADSNSSRPPSRSGVSRPPSPLSSSSTLPPRVPVTEADWHATYPPVSSNDRSRPPSRFSRHDSMPVPMPRIDVQSPSPARPPQPAAALPYPVDDRQADVFMPPAEDFQYDHSFTPTSPNPNLRSPYPDSPKLSPSPIPASPRDRPSPTYNRPTMPSRHTAAPEELPRAPRVRSNSIRSQSSHDGRRSERNSMSLNKPLPSCPRSEASSRYDDWYTLESCPNFDICPSCYTGVFADTKFADYFTPVRRYNSRFCDFSSPWIRLAWLLTIKQRRDTPDLLYALAAIIDINRPCPNDREVQGTDWFGISDQRDGTHVANFRVCPCDLKMIEALFPSVRGYMTRLNPTNQINSLRPQLCSLRLSSKRYPKYLDLLVELDETARLKGRSPDIQRFIGMARDNAFKEECSRDNAVVRKPWHFIPSLPEFTVCEECYDEVVWPAIQNRNSVAKLFNRNLQLVPGEDMNGSSCCLYSPRMRRVWERALEDQDFNYLKRRAIERKRNENKLNRDKSELVRWLESMELNGGYRESEFDRLRRDLRAVEDDWKRYE